MEKLAQDKFKDTQLKAFLLEQKKLIATSITFHMNYVPIFELENPLLVFLVNV